MVKSVTQDLALNCIFSSQNDSKTLKKMKPYIKATLFHGGSSKSEKHVAENDVAGNFNFQFYDVNVETAYLHFEVFSPRQFLQDKRIGDIDIQVSELVVPGEKSSWGVYELGKGNKKGNKDELKLSYKLSSSGEDLTEAPSSHEKSMLDSKQKQCLITPALGNDIALYKMLLSYRAPLVSLTWN